MKREEKSRLKTETRLIEYAYRRGFSQAIWFTFQSLGFSESRLWSLDYYERVWRWKALRDNHHWDERVAPPLITDEEREQILEILSDMEKDGQENNN